MKKTLIAVTTMAALCAFAGLAQDAEDPFAKVVKARQGLMLQMSTDLGTLAGMAKGETGFDQALATKAAANIAAVASVISLQQFPAGSEFAKSPSSFTLVDLWSKQDDFLIKITDLNNAAAMMQNSAATDADAIKGSLAQLGGTCTACHKAYRQSKG